METSMRVASLPEFFRPILWSYDMRQIDIWRDKKTIIVQSLNYGDLEHWQWLVRTYGREEIKKLLAEIPITEFRPRVRRLIMLIFGIEVFSHASRSTH